MPLLGLGLPAAAAVLVAWAYWPAPPVRPAAFRAFQAFLAAGCGLALSSCAFFLWFPVFGHPKYGYVPFEAVVCLVLIAGAARRLRGRPITPPAAPPPAAEPPWVRWLWVPFVVSAVVAGLFLFATSNREPHGHWDAFGIWNVRARFLFRGLDRWADTFSPLLWHADYPLFVPATVARAWCYTGEDSTTAPVAVAVVMLALTAGTLVSGLNYLRGGGQGWVAGALLLAGYPFVYTASIQYADVPASFFFLAAVAALAVRDQTGGRALGVLAGAAAGFAAWTKNEGLLFAAALVVCRVAVHVRRSRRELFRELLPFAAGLVPAAVALAVFKFGYAPPNDLVSGPQGGVLGRLLDGTRHAQVVVGFAREVWAVAPFAVVVLGGYAVLAGLPPAARRVPGWAATWLVLGAVTAGYYLVYVALSLNVSWHLATSLGRLVAQLWPLFLFALFLTLDTPHEPDRPAKAAGGSEPPARPAVPRRDGRRLPLRLRRG